MEKKMIEITKADGSVEKVELVTYLKSGDGLRQYVVYTKGEVQGDTKDYVIYISRFHADEGSLKIEGITDNTEWSDVQHLLKRIANA